MADKAKKREKHRLKRLKKQREARRLGSITPLQRLAKSGGRLECWVNSDWKEQGLANISVFGTASDGRAALAMFLVDVWCVGLKDLFGHSEFTRARFDDSLKTSRERMPMMQIDPAVARGLVAGGIRFSRQNGFKLPDGWNKWIGIFGGLGDIESADLSDFGKDGKLFYVGTEEFLRRRLIACTPAEFVRAHSADFLIGGPDGDVYDENRYAQEEEEDVEEDDETDETPEDLSAKLGQFVFAAANNFIETTKQWCKARGTPPPARLERAAEYLAATATTAHMFEPLSRDTKAVSDSILNLMEQTGETEPETIVTAIGQILEAVSEAGRARSKEETPWSPAQHGSRFDPSRIRTIGETVADEAPSK